MFAGSYREFLPFCNRFFSINWHLPDTFQVDTTLFGSDKQIFSQKKLIANKAKIAFRVKEEPLTYFLKAFLFDFACFAFAVDIFPVWPDGGFWTACILAICNVFRLQTLLLHLTDYFVPHRSSCYMFWRFH